MLCKNSSSKTSGLVGIQFNSLPESLQAKYDFLGLHTTGTTNNFLDLNNNDWIDLRKYHPQENDLASWM